MQLIQLKLRTEYFFALKAFSLNNNKYVSQNDILLITNIDNDVDNNKKINQLNSDKIITAK